MSHRRDLFQDGAKPRRVRTNFFFLCKKTKTASSSRYTPTVAGVEQSTNPPQQKLHNHCSTLPPVTALRGKALSEYTTRWSWHTTAHPKPSPKNAETLKLYACHGHEIRNTAVACCCTIILCMLQELYHTINIILRL